MTTQTVAQASGTFTLGGDLTVNRLGFGAMRITGKGIWGPPQDSKTAIAVLRRAVTWFHARGVTVERVLSDNGSCYRSFTWRDTCTATRIPMVRESGGFAITESAGRTPIAARSPYSVYV